MEKFGIYRFSIIEYESGWIYEIYTDEGTRVRQSTEKFKYEGIARFAAIGHISLLEQGKG